MKKLFLLVGLLGTIGLTQVNAQASLDPPCTPSCEKAPSYAMHRNTDTGELCCLLTTNPLNSCTGQPC
ncbi:MAG: hypothetical protein EP311_05730 [Cytophagales bacterium]|nr:MAG: hypothetical protein EP311_05730 [Cytophagales bacterium]